MARAITDTESSTAPRPRETAVVDGVHPCWRLESHITDFKEYKDGESTQMKENTGWLQVPQERERATWKANEQEFTTPAAAAAA